MKSYFAKDQLHLSGKAWEVRAVLAMWKKKAAQGTEMRQFIADQTYRK
ncbi:MULTISPECIES: Z-ring formation inhibitor MciZ [Paenibacillus]|nr:MULTISPECIES: Z-ring formation inhibitor MciZ [Paenibacillus]GIP20184.1 hypothetical protein J22TS3_04590 [Paenibacillus sp. J22TS3]